MPQVSNYCSSLNRQAKAHTQRWIVRAIYADSRLNTEYLYRSALGARNQLAYLNRMIALDSVRSLGSEIPMIAAEMIETIP